MMKFQEKYLGWKIRNGETKKTGFKDTKIEGAEMFHPVRGALHSEQHMKEGKEG